MELAAAMPAAQGGGGAAKIWGIGGRSTSGTSAFGRCRVSVGSRVPSPPAMITSCIRAPMRGRGYVFCPPSASLRHDRDDVVPPEDDRPDAAEVVFLRLLRILEDHVHVVVVADELALENPVGFEEELHSLVDGFF